MTPTESQELWRLAHALGDARADHMAAGLNYGPDSAQAKDAQATVASANRTLTEWIDAHTEM